MTTHTEWSRSNDSNDRDHTGVLFHSTHGRIGNARDDAGNVYQTDDSAEVTISAATQSEQGEPFGNPNG
jgi:hypothetical protein